PIQAYSQALDLIEKRIDPKRASEVLGNLNSYIFDRIITPALKRPESAEKAKEMAQQQAELNRRLFEVTGRPVAPPPDPEWIRYKGEMVSILSDQTTLILDLTPLIQDKPDQTAETLSYMTKRANEALQFPEGLIHLKAEMLDRLGLAFQAAREWGQARQAFERAYGLNEGLDLVKNLSANQRSIAYNAYMEAGTLSGDERKRLLETSYKGFEHLIELVHRYGAVGQEKKGKEGLISVSLDFSLDKVSSSQAMYGFSPDQEVRLAQAFMARIKTELGELIPAQNAILKQLNNYPVGRSIPDEDLYGVSLLYHRAGHLAYAGRKPMEAFNHFMRSAEISLRMKNPVSAALNVMNMAQVLSGIPPENPERKRCYSQLMGLDRKTTRLLDQSSEVMEALIIPSYHNAMGVFILKMDPKERTSPEMAVRRMKKQEEAYVHFFLGLEGLDNDSTGSNREALELLAAIHLNMAEIAGLWGEPLKAREHLENALKTARKGLLPQYEWRALAGLGQLKAALAVLETVSILKAECGPGEITTQFAPSVSALINEGEPEEAFNLLERLSEIERVHRLRPLIIGEIPPAERSLLIRVYSRLIKIKQLSSELKRAKKADKSYLSKRLNREKELLDMDIGSDREQLPPPARLSGSKKLQDWIMILLGLALHAEDVADSAVKKGMGPDTILLQQQYEKLMKQYWGVLKKAKAIASKEETPGVISIFGPDPVEAIDLMEELPEGAACIRIIPASHKGPERLAFVVTPEDLTVQTFKNQPPFDLPGNGPHIIASEDPSGLPADISYALSGTHLVRSIRNRKPFKRRVLTLPPQQILPEYFHVKALPETATNREIIDGLIGRDVILFSTPVYEAGSVPTRPGQIPARTLAMELDSGRTFSLDLLSDHLSEVSLAILPGASEKDVYPLGHLFSLFGVPTLLLPGQSKGDSLLIEQFFRAYEVNSANRALNVASAKIKTGVKTGAKKDEGWIQVGYWGMTPEEARLFSQKHFKGYVKKGVQAFKSKHPLKALSFFENALNIATEIKSFRRFIPELHKYARESAYASGRYQKAIFHAQKLVDILASAKPDSKEYAEALLRLGLVEARAEKYDQAIPTLEKSAAIMADLELGPRQIAALNDLAIVLENATHYDRALEQFESAAALSRGMDKEELLAKQYMRIGRIYDLRLSSYAKAKQFYTKAYAIYKRLRKQNKMAQALLDIGRCCRLLGNFREAEEHYKQALDLTGTKRDNLRLKANILMEQANNAWYQARYQTAFGLQRKVIDLADQNEWPLEKVMAFNTSGLTWWTLGDHERALRELEDALSVARTLRIRRDEVATSLNNIGLVYREMGEFKKGLKALEKALAIDREIKSKWAIAYDLKNIALTYLEMGKPEKAATLFEEALATASEIGNKINEAKILLGYGDALASAGRDAEADTAFQKALKLSRSMALRETEWPALYGIAKLRLKADKKEEARGLLFEALSVIEGMRAEIKIDQLKDKFISNKLGVYETLVSLLVDMGKTREAFDIAERSRARNFIDLLGSQRLTLKGKVDQDLYDRQKTIQSRIDEHQTLLAQAGNKDERKAYQRDLKRLEDQYQDLMSEIQAKNPELATLVSVNPLNLTQVQALLEPDVAVLVYYTLPDEILCWHITAHSVELFRTPLGRKTLGKAVLNYRRMLQNLEPLEDQSRELYSWLFAPIMPKLGSARILGIVPHGILHHLSFATLYDGNNYVADRIPLFYLPSASLLRYTLDRRKTDKNMRVLAIGNPDLNNPALDLPFAEREVSTIHWNFPDTTLLTRDKATESWVIRHIGDFGIIHLASHGEFDAVNPLFSAIKLAKDAHNDGDLKASETFGLQINADLVMLSACQTGLGKITNGDDVIGLNRAFLYAGTHSIISSLWRVSDISTAMLVKQFYREYKTQNKANSLRRAILHVKNRYPHPGYWGAFLLVGDYD
ncbi:MAG: CHAT domain-containing protein, partial [Deltaproteobacteria bacterium]|nr:CHAT domain-containing protein [Deltaproteobacteria bacterium]